MVYDISLDHALYTDSTSFEFEAHSLIDPLLHKYLFQNIEKSLSEDVAYIDAVKRDIHDHAVTIASIAKKRPDAKIPA